MAPQVGAARVTWHQSLDDEYRDVKLWKDCGLSPGVPLVDFGRLCVRRDFRRRGIAKSLDAIRLREARLWKLDGLTSRCCVCTASTTKVDSLTKMVSKSSSTLCLQCLRVCRSMISLHLLCCLVFYVGLRWPRAFTRLARQRYSMIDQTQFSMHCNTTLSNP